MGGLKAPSGARRRANFFQIFCRPAPAAAPHASLIDWKRSNFFRDPLCDDLLTIGVDSPEGGAYNPNH